MGARPQHAAELRRPVNPLEAGEDPDGVWRSYVNDALAGAYQRLFSRIAFFALLLAPSFEIVPRWRQQQEHELRRRSPSARTMTDDEVTRFVQLYERLTRHMARSERLAKPVAGEPHSVGASPTEASSARPPGPTAWR